MSQNLNVGVLSLNESKGNIFFSFRDSSDATGEGGSLVTAGPTTATCHSLAVNVTL